MEYLETFVAFLNVAVIWWLVWSHDKTVKDLTNKIMAKNYGEYVQAEMIKNPPPVKPGLDVKVKEQDNEPDSVEILNQIL